MTVDRASNMDAAAKKPGAYQQSSVSGWEPKISTNSVSDQMVQICKLSSHEKGHKIQN